MPISPDELAARVSHLASLVFTETAVVGLLAAVVLWAVARSTGADGRRRALVAASVGVIAWLVTPALALAWVAATVLLWVLVEHVRPRTLAAAGVAALLVAVVVAPVYWIGALGERGPRVRELVAFATNMALLRAVATVADRWRRGGRPIGLERTLLGNLFFPTFVNGPVEAPQRLDEPWPRPSVDDLRVGLLRIAVGVGKMALVALALPPGFTAGLAADVAAPAWRLWGWAALLYVWFYLTFSAWSDVAIGLGRACGRRVTENFDRPWLATDVADFWRRWHVSLGHWLRDYVYIPLGGNRRHRALNVAAVFLVSAAWHVWGTLKLLGFGYFPMRAWWGFLVWGALHALAVALVPRIRLGLPVPLARAATFAFAAAAWLPFFAPGGVDVIAGLRMLVRLVLPIGG
jgi:alginate O-acetyltransferase complex protein AlgI